MEGQSNGSQTVIFSSIALLQERFRQLQRTKEIRQEKQQLLQMIADTQQPRWFFHPELIRPPSRPVRASPFHQLGRHCDSADPRCFKASLSVSLCSNNSDVHAFNTFSEMDVDTSLHL